MGNIVTTIKRFLSNKNTVTIIGVILGLVVLYVGYNYRVNTAVETVTVPYAKKTIGATKEITADLVGTMEILKSTVKQSKTLIQNYGSVVNTAESYCVAERAGVPEGGFFYNNQIKRCKEINRRVFDDMPDGYKAVSLSVNIKTTYGNSMYPGDYIDIWVKSKSQDNKLIYGELITKLPILDVRDNNGNSLYYGSSSTTNTPSVLLFAVPNYDTNGDNLYLLLSKATMLTTLELVPVPGNASYSSEVGETRVTSQYLKNFIEQQTVHIPDSAVPDVQE